MSNIIHIKQDDGPYEEASFDGSDLTIEQGAAVLMYLINSLFAANRIAKEPDECRAYLETFNSNGSFKDRYFYKVFKNGEDGDAQYDHPFREIASSENLHQAILDTVRLVAKTYPDHALQQVIWRRSAEVRHRNGRYDVNVRLTATELGV